MSSVFLTNVDDYIGPSQACVNPLFTGTTGIDDPVSSVNHDNPSQATTTTTTTNASHNEDGGAVSISRRARRKITARSTTNNITTNGDTANLVSTSPPTIPSTIPPPAPVKASIVDCLACSGCITTAETVLLEQHHSISQFQLLLGLPPEIRPTIVLTVSPASWADLLRMVSSTTRVGDKSTMSNNSNNNKSKEKNDTDKRQSSSGKTTIPYQQQHHPSILFTRKRQMVTILHRYLHCDAVLDGLLPQHWAQQEAAEEFVRYYQQQQQQQQQPTSSSSYTTQQRQQQQPPPLVSGSCPATVCLIEKNVHSAIPFVATTKSPMSLAGEVWRAIWTRKNYVPWTTSPNNPNIPTKNGSSNHNHNNIIINNNENNHTMPNATATECTPSSWFHVAVMPCHDKKLEASRAELNGLVDLVLTSQECYELLLHQHEKEEESHDNTQKTMVNNDGGHYHSGGLLPLSTMTPLAPVTGDITQYMPGSLITIPEELIHVTCIEEEAPIDDNHVDNIGRSNLSSSGNHSNQRQATTTTNTTFSPYSSGGYADYIFRYAARVLFGVRLSFSEDLPWIPVTVGSTMPPISTNGPSTSVFSPSSMVSARVAKASRREFYQVSLFRHGSSGGDGGKNEGGVYYSTSPVAEDGCTSGQPVLQFAIANGMQTIQRALQTFQSPEENPSVVTTQPPSSSSSSPPWSQPSCNFHYLELMACPSGCINGGGQIRLGSRETPTETRKRVSSSKEWFTPYTSVMTASSSSLSKSDTGNDCDDDDDDTIHTILKRPGVMHTTYRSIAPLQYTMGATAGISVQDTKW